MAPAQEHRATIIWLHGLGADGHDFEPVIPALGLPASLGVRFLFPEAPRRPVTLNGGMVMRAWYDIEALAREGHVHRGQLAESVAGVRALLERERESGMPPERLALAGFSQGGAVALQTAVGAGPEPPPRLAGVLALSTYLPLPELAPPPTSPAAPIFQAHGTFDELVPFPLGARSRDLLEASGREVEFHAYPMGHQVSEEEIRDAGRFLRRILGARS